MRFCEFRKKQVINICDGRCLGYVDDLEFNECNGQICALILRDPGRWFGLFGCDCEYIIGWDRIRKVGPDVIMVEVCLDKIRKKM